MKLYIITFLGPLELRRGGCPELRGSLIILMVSVDVKQH